ncbi:ferritin-like domain-containing protein [Cerasicoccus arenae]|uniref:DUF2383 domain-containing protein n=1 Tax=Cerasicoccus arenae TaxID=424488 RepID=A0A8J3D7B7_9BACT|nr:PA2169 family four-helix-bundle protein [Cerasicoccus arenae]MBK1857091.1 PA2169 family four-helix-bundle protein [Cerasicoccus arenae]GHB92310.1 hypothetical protein GCM10007047_04240 [Cerasicoccus arenae]
MSNLKSKLANNLSSINEYCNDSVKGFEEAADSIQDTNARLAANFKVRANERRVFSERLSERLLCIGEDREDGGSLSGAIHRGILKLKEAFTSDDVSAVINECIRGEEGLRDEVDEALNSKADPETTSVLLDLKQHVSVSIGDLNLLKQ